MNNRSGYTLVEIVIAMGFIACVILYCFLILTQSFSIVRSSEDDLVAVSLAHKQMEFFRSGFERIPPIGGPYDFENCPEDYNRINLIPPTTIKGQDYIVKTTVSAVPDHNPEKFRHVKVEVFRKGGEGFSPRKVTVESYIYKY